ncbi:MAG: rRNA pseudouridine synthase [Clostridia bacterium]|nr:rRNA pseudouridine synthase [Clostridia bacterium]
MRLNKFLALAGLGSRRVCDDIIAAGRVSVNGKPVINQIGIDIDMGQDVVVVDNKPIKVVEPYVYYMLHKPLSTITSVHDENNRKTVLEYIPEYKGRLFPVGRLDYNTSGLLVLTNDGEVAQKLLHPKFEIEKTYLVTIRHKLTSRQLTILSKGIDLGDFVTKPAQLKLVSSNQFTAIYSITIHEGKNRQIRRMFAAIGVGVLGLKRVKFGKLELGSLSYGHYRRLSKLEIEYLLSI